MNPEARTIIFSPSELTARSRAPGLLNIHLTVHTENTVFLHINFVE